MRFGDLVNKAKKVVDQRGGTEALKQDAEELKDIARAVAARRPRPNAAEAQVPVAPERSRERPADDALISGLAAYAMCGAPEAIVGREASRSRPSSVDLVRRRRNSTPARLIPLDHVR